MTLDVTSRPPAQALKYWQSRVPVTADQFQELEKSARQRAFAVSGLTRQELVNEAHVVLHQALEEGLPLQQARKRLREVLAKEADAPPGLLKKHRIDTIIRTNLQHAYQAGRYAQMQQVAKERPIWRYSAVMDRRTRPAHAALHGRCHRADHEFWSQYYPPNGFACRCTVSSLSEAQAERKGYTVETELPGPVEVVDKRTGEVRQVIPTPDPGFGRNPGRDWLSGLSPSELDEALRPLPLKTLCRDGKGLFAGEPCCPSLDQLDDRHILRYTSTDLLPRGMDDMRYIEAFLKEFGKRKGQSTMVTLPGVQLPVVISDALFQNRKNLTWKVQKEGREQYLRLLARTILNPFEVWEGMAAVGRGQRQVVVPSLSLIRLWSDGAQKVGGLSIFRMVGGRRWQGITTFPPGKNEREMLRYLEQERAKHATSGTLLWREK